MAYRFHFALLPAAALALALALASGCSDAQPTGTRIIDDPTRTRHESGGTDDILEVCQQMLNSMRRSPKVAAKPSKIIILDQEGIVVDPKLRDYNARIIYNDFQSKLNKVGQEFSFLDRQAVARERARQLGGEVKTSGVDAATAGADMALTIELIAQSGAQTNTVQYTFKLTDVKDGQTLWADSALIQKLRT